MKNYSIVIFSLMFLFNVSKSQTAHFVSLGADLGVPNKNFGNANIGLGGSFEYLAKISKVFGIQTHIGYSHFTNKIHAPVGVFIPPTE